MPRPYVTEYFVGWPPLSRASTDALEAESHFRVPSLLHVCFSERLQALQKRLRQLGSCRLGERECVLSEFLERG